MSGVMAPTTSTTTTGSTKTMFGFPTLPDGHRRSPDHSKTAQDVPKRAPRGRHQRTSGAQDGSRGAQDGSMRGPRRGPHQRFPALGLKQTPEGPKRPPTDPEEVPKGHKGAQEAPRRPPRGPQEPKRLPREHVPGKASGNMIPAALRGARATGDEGGGLERREERWNGGARAVQEGDHPQVAPKRLRRNPEVAPTRPCSRKGFWEHHSRGCASRGERGKGAVGREERWNGRVRGVKERLRPDVLGGGWRAFPPRLSARAALSRGGGGARSKRPWSRGPRLQPPPSLPLRSALRYEPPTLASTSALRYGAG